MENADPNEAYEIHPTTEGHFLYPGWTVMQSGVPVRYFTENQRPAAERYVSDQAYRADVKFRETPLHLREKK